VVQTWLVVLQAEPFAQSLGTLQPHAPPPLVVKQAAPRLELAHGTHAPPVAPQVAAAVPTTQVPFAQQPSLQIFVESHAAPQVCVTGSHAE
jgi:hypothetical protein